MEEDKKEVKKPRKVKKVVKHLFKETIGTRNGKPRYEKGQSYELTKEQVKNYKQNNII